MSYESRYSRNRSRTREPSPRGPLRVDGLARSDASYMPRVPLPVARGSDSASCTETATAGNHNLRREGSNPASPGRASTARKTCRDQEHAVPKPLRKWHARKQVRMRRTFASARSTALPPTPNHQHPKAANPNHPEPHHPGAVKKPQMCSWPSKAARCLAAKSLINTS